MNARVMIDDEAVARALAADKTCARVLAKGLRPAPGDLVGVRLNLNLFKSQKIAVQTIHKGNRTGRYKDGAGFFNGESLWYQKAVVLAGCFFNVSQLCREKIASGAESKFPMASCDGQLVDDPEPKLEGVEIRFDPKKVHLFVDAENRPVRWAESVTVYGHRAYARGILVYYDEDTAPPKAGDSPSAVVFQP
jgi:hypothetical protein